MGFTGSNWGSCLTTILVKYCFTDIYIVHHTGIKFGDIGLIQTENPFGWSCEDSLDFRNIKSHVFNRHRVILAGLFFKASSEYFAPEFKQMIDWLIVPEWLLSELEWLVVILNLLFIVLLVAEHISCWIFGILGSILAGLLFLQPEVRLYSEAVLYLIYAVLGGYGWWSWEQRRQNNFRSIISWTWKGHLVALAIGVAFWCIIGGYMARYTNASMVWCDAFSTAFSLVATYLEAKKVLEGWFYWMVLNVFSIWLYAVKQLDQMAIMMVVFSILSVLGYWRWRKSFLLQAEVQSR